MFLKTIKTITKDVQQLFSSQTLYVEYLFEEGRLTTMIVLLQEHALDLKL